MLTRNREITKKGHTYVQWIAAILANSMTLSYGLESGWISANTRHLQAESSPTGAPVSDIAMSWIASAFSLTAAIGVPIFGYIANRYGSKIAVIILYGPQMISWVIKIIYPSRTSFIIARAISGLSAGGVFNVVPLYVKEISQDSIRGVLGTLLLVMLNVGMFTMYLMGAYLDYYTILYVAVALETVSVILMLKAPQSPSFLVKQGNIKEATESIALLRGLDKEDEGIQKEIEYMKSVEEQFQARQDISIWAIVKDPAWRRGFILIMATFLIHDACGVYMIITYAFAILSSTGVKFDIRPELQIVSMPCMMVVASLLLTAIVEKCGRKILLAGAYLIMSLSMLTLGSAILIQNLGGSVPSWLPILAMVVAVCMYAGGVCPLPYIIVTEMFSFQVRVKIMGVVITCAWFTASMTVAAYEPMRSAFGDYSIFFICAALNMVGAIFVTFCLPETKGKTDEEIRIILSKKVKDPPNSI